MKTLIYSIYSTSNRCELYTIITTNHTLFVKFTIAVIYVAWIDGTSAMVTLQDRSENEQGKHFVIRSAAADVGAQLYI